MSDKTAIEWTDATWNPVTGCTKVSAGCKHCYAERDWARLTANPKTRYHGREFTDVQFHMSALDQPLRWTKPRRIFVCSMSDLFHDDVPDIVIVDVFAVIAAARRHTFQVLTKRPQRAVELLNDEKFKEAVEEALALHCDDELAWPLPNLEFGVTTENQAAADERIPLLLQVPAAVRWLSVEPLLSPLRLDKPNPIPSRRDEHGIGIEWIEEATLLWGIDWVVVAGESGPNARPMHPDWVRSLRDQCAVAGVPFLFKQWGEWGHDGRIPQLVSIHERSVFLNIDGTEYRGPSQSCPKTTAALIRVGKKAAGRLLDGQLHDEYPKP